MVLRCLSSFFFFFFNDTATTEIYTLSLHDALPICRVGGPSPMIECGSSTSTTPSRPSLHNRFPRHVPDRNDPERSEEHTSELQSPCNLVCRLLLEKKKKSIRHCCSISIH